MPTATPRKRKHTWKTTTYDTTSQKNVRNNRSAPLETTHAGIRKMWKHQMRGLKLKLKLKPTCHQPVRELPIPDSPWQSCLDSNTTLGANGEQGLLGRATDNHYRLPVPGVFVNIFSMSSKDILSALARKSFAKPGRQLKHRMQTNSPKR
jgi:hypothetical protein